MTREFFLCNTSKRDRALLTRLRKRLASLSRGCASRWYREQASTSIEYQNIEPSRLCTNTNPLANSVRVWSWLLRAPVLLRFSLIIAHAMLPMVLSPVCDLRLIPFGNIFHTWPRAREMRWWLEKMCRLFLLETTYRVAGLRRRRSLIYDSLCRVDAILWLLNFFFHLFSLGIRIFIMWYSFNPIER